MRVLMVGDVVGKGGRRALSALLSDIRREYGVHFVSVQGENAAAGFGLTAKVADEILQAGADVITSGNHIWDKREFVPMLKSRKYLTLRPHNYPESAPGAGIMEFKNIAVINLLGRVFVKGELDSPFAVVDKVLQSGFGANKPIVVDMHAEATSEKYAIGWHLDGRVAAVVGTHTHTPTADARILPNGTAYVSDLGMVGARNSILGMEREAVLQRFLTGVPHRFKPVESGTMQFNSVLIDIDDKNHKATHIERIDREWTV